MGHVAIGQTYRGAVIGVTIGILWLSGLLIGGVNVIDRERSGIMYFGQVLLAPGVIIDLTMQNRLKSNDPQLPTRPHDYEPSYGRVHEHGMLYTALAGLLNLLAIVDVLYREPRRLAANEGVSADAEPEGAT